MLTESQVIHHVCAFLEGHGFVILQRLTETQQGYDIIASRPDLHSKVAIEAKGETSSKSYTKRFGSAFSYSQVYVHVAQAYYCASTYEAAGFMGAIALPKTSTHVKKTKAIREALAKLNIEVFFVSPDGEVEVWKHWGIWNEPESLPAVA
jgi:hypothetical protein